MKVSLSRAGKRFNREWIFRNVSLDFFSSRSYAITGANGSGKSTFLQSVGGMFQLSEGDLTFSFKDKVVPPEHTFQHISFSAPYLELIEEMTLWEFLSFHFKFKPILGGIDAEQIIEIINLETAAKKQMRYYSSGMKQRVKLAQAIFSETTILLLDEPCSNLDSAGIELYHHLIKNYTAGRLVMVSSNDQIEYSFCDEKLSINDFKK